jgi:hypothetical protein
MKKLFFTLFFGMMALFCNAQIYTAIKYLDKFDDELKSEQHKTLITKTDTTFVIEEKGKQPITYYILNVVEEGTKGSKDNIVNLIDDLYGYEEAWIVIRYDMLDKFREALNDYKLNSMKEALDKVTPHILYVVHRTLTTQYAGNYIMDMFWLQDDLIDGKLGKDIKRIIYTNNL